MRSLIVLLFLVCSVKSFAAAIDARFMTSGFNTLFSEKTTDALAQGSTNKYYATSLFNTDFAAKTTDNLSQGSTNKYYSSSLFDSDFLLKTTDSLSEGSTNKYYHVSTARSDLLTSSISASDTTHAPTGDAVNTALGLKVNSSLIGAANGIVPLNSSSKIDVTYLPNAIMFYKGAWNPATNTPTLADSACTSLEVGQVYRASVQGTVNLGSGSHTWQVGDFAICNGSTWDFSPAADGVVSVNGLQGAVTLTTDNISEGSTNKYFSNTLARSAISASSTTPITYNSTSGEIGIAQVSSSQDGYLSASQYNTLAAGNVNPFKETLTLTGTNITNQYVDMGVQCKASSLTLIVGGASAVAEGLDYTVSVVSTKTRITFAGDLASGGATPLISGDKLYAQCLE